MVLCSRLLGSPGTSHLRFSNCPSGFRVEAVEVTRFGQMAEFFISLPSLKVECSNLKVFVVP